MPVFEGECSDPGRTEIGQCLSCQILSLTAPRADAQHGGSGKRRKRESFGLP